MKLICSKKEYSESKGKDLLPLVCYNCDKIFYKTKTWIKSYLKRKLNGCKYCCVKCSDESQKKSIKLHCKNCNKTIIKSQNQIKKSKSGNTFCCRSCSTTYNNTHKKQGYRRSKIEIWIEHELIKLYPNLSILFNDKYEIGSEIDIYIPSLNLAFELNGIFHYKPIFGENKLTKIINNDSKKFYLCQQKNINLCIIDISTLNYFKPNKAKKFLDIITNIINQNLNKCGILDSNQ